MHGPATAQTGRAGDAAELSRAALEPLGAVEAALAAVVEETPGPDNLREAIGYSLLAGGKRLRPLLVVHGCLACGGRVDAGLPPACAVEMIHAFSLIHDDLPALDDDDLRRGQPTSHKKFGEAMAILAGDGLMSLAFSALESRVPDPVRCRRLIGELARGTSAMIGGQVYDTLGGFPAELSNDERLGLIHRNKTGALLRASCRMGAIAGAADPSVDGPGLDAMTRYGEAVGLMFQIVDDLLDVEQTTEHLGKRSSKDAEAGKLTFPEVLGVERSRREIDRLRDEASSAARSAPEPAAGAVLAEICEYLAVRTR